MINLVICNRAKRPIRAAAALACLLACATGAVHADDGAIFVTSPDQPLNVGDAMLAATAYHDSGTYDRDVELVARQAAQWIAERAPSARRPALVLDVDDTSLSNWEVIERDNFGRPIAGPCDLALDAPCGWAAWDQLGRDPAILPTLDQLGRDPAILPTLQVFQKARALGVAVFFITGRPENQRAATERNLAAAGYAG